MIKNIVKAIILGLLIVLCIWQTGILWLGNVSSHNFLHASEKRGYYAQPRGIWVNAGSNYTLALPVKETKREYQRLMEELAVTLKEGFKSSAPQLVSDVDYSKLLSINGILFEYGCHMPLDQIAGINLQLSQDMGMIDTVFVDIVDSIGDTLHVYFINSKEQLFYRLELYGNFEFFKRIKDTYSNEEATKNLLKYQPGVASGIKSYIKDGKNFFLPSVSEKTPLIYKVLTSSNPVEGMVEEERLSKLKEYINPFFLNPFITNIEYKNNGDIVFADNMSTIIKYSPVGVLEYRNTSSNEGPQKYTVTESFNQAMTFIMNAKGIPEYIKEGMYLSCTRQDDGMFTFYFDIRYDGYKIELRQAFKNELEMTHFLEVSVNNGVVSRAKWIILDIAPKEIYEEGRITEGYQEITDKMLVSRQDRLLLDDLQCVYVMNATGRDMHINWRAVSNGNVYYP